MATKNQKTEQKQSSILLLEASKVSSGGLWPNLPALSFQKVSPEEQETGMTLEEILALGTEVPSGTARAKWEALGKFH